MQADTANAVATDSVPAFETIRTAVLTERGHAVAAVYRLLAALRELDVADRRDVLELLGEELEHQGLTD